MFSFLKKKKKNQIEKIGSLKQKCYDEAKEIAKANDLINGTELNFIKDGLIFVNIVNNDLYRHFVWR